MHNIFICENVLQCHVKFTHVVFAKTIFVPADSIQHQAVHVHNIELQFLIPFWVQALVDGRCRLLRVSQREYQELVYALVGPPKAILGCTCRIAAVILVLRRQISSLDHLDLQGEHCSFWFRHYGSVVAAVDSGAWLWTCTSAGSCARRV